MDVNVADKQWFTNKQVLGLLGFSISMGIGYGEFRGMQANDELQDFEIKMIEERADAEEAEMKALIYTKARDNNDKTTRMVQPLRAAVKRLEDESNFNKGYNAAHKDGPKREGE
jgi:hypothetical protein